MYNNSHGEILRFPSSQIQQLAQDSSQCNNTNEKLDIIDGLMALTCEHLKSCVDDGRLIEVLL